MANNITTLRLTGLSSGMDTDTIIKQMMQIEQLKVNRELRKRTTLEWKQEALKNLASDFKEFKQTYMSVLSPKNLYSSAAFNSFEANITGENSDAVTVKAGTDTWNGAAVNINSISQLAAAAKLESNNISNGGGLSNTNATKLKDLNFKNNLEFVNGEISFSINGKSFRFNENDSLQSMMNTINASDAGVTMSYSRLTDGFKIESNETGSNSTLKVENIYGNAFGNDGAFGIGVKSSNVGLADGAFVSSSNKIPGVSYGNWSDTSLDDFFGNSLTWSNSALSFSINGEQVSINKYKTVMKDVVDGDGNTTQVESLELTTFQDFANALDAKGVKVALNQEVDGAYLQLTNNTGKTLSITNIGGNLFGANSLLGIDLDTNQNASGTAITAQGQDAILDIDGALVMQKSNTFTVDGLTYTLNNTFDGSEGPVKVKVTQNADPAIEKVREFVSGYNTMIEKLNNMVTERKTNSEKGYTALTDEEKEAMTEEQVKQWETIAKKGLLYNDSSIKDVITKLRSALYDTVSGVGLSPADIGLRTSQDWIGKSGQIELDEDLLRKALESNPEKVISVFTDLSSSTDSSTKYNENGLLNRISGIFDNYTSNVQPNSLDSMNRTLNELNNRIDKLETRMIDLEERYYKQYAAMESALAKIQSQSDWLSGMLGSLG